MMGVAVVATASCADSGDSEPHAGSQVQRRDSAGIEVVLNGSAAITREWATLPGEPELRLGSLDGTGPTQFANVRTLIPRRDGGVVVAESQSRELRAFAADGTHLWTAGGAGDGPGEFAELTTAGPFAGDSVLVFDSRADRITFFGPTGGFGRSVSLAFENVARPYRMSSSSDGHLLSRARYFGSSGSPPTPSGELTFERDSVTLRWVSADGRPGEVLTDPVPDMERLTRVTTRGTMFVSESMALPWGRYSYEVLGSGGAWVGVADTFELRWYDPVQGLARIVRAPGLEQDLTQAEVEAFRERRTEAAETPAAREAIADWFELSPKPDRRPAFSGFVVDAADRLWVSEWAEPGRTPETVWVFSPDGTLLGQVGLPPGFTLAAATTEALWGVTKDELDVPYVVRYRLQR